MKVIFLDVDGVLNNDNFFQRVYKDKNAPIDETAVRCLKYLVDKTSAVIVLSSTWRLSIEDDLTPKNKNSKALLDMFQQYEIPLYGKTPYINSWRENEIEQYLSNHPEVSDFVILDDDFFDLQKYKDHLIKINRHIGFNIEYAQSAIDKLNGKTRVKKQV